MKSTYARRLSLPNTRVLPPNNAEAGLDGALWRAMKPKSLVIFIPTLAAGGTERAGLNLAPAFMKAGFDITLLVQRRTGALAHHIPADIRVVSLDCNRTLACLIPLVRFLQRERPDIFISNMGHSNIISILARPLSRVSTRVITCHHNTLSIESRGRGTWQYRVLPLLCRLFLRRADAIVAVSQGVADDLAAVAGLQREQITVIYNPVVTDDFDRRMHAPVAHRWLNDKTVPVIVAAGRLVESKDFATLLRAFARVLEKRDARLIILGDGPLYDELTSLAERLDISDRVDFPGFQENPLPFIRHAAVFALSSRYEGFGNVLAEALACGTPVVSTNCPSGPSEILDGSRFGMLVPVGDPQAMADAITLMLDIPLPADLLQRRGREFTAAKAADAYINIFNSLGLRVDK